MTGPGYARGIWRFPGLGSVGGQAALICTRYGTGQDYSSLMVNEIRRLVFRWNYDINSTNYIRILFRIIGYLLKHDDK